MAASLLAVSACNGNDTQDQPMPAETAMVGDETGMMGEELPAAGEFAQTVAMSDMYEIAAAQVALERADGTPTRQFAQMMIDDHGKSTEALKQAVAQSGQTVAMPEGLDAEHQAKVDMLKTMNGPDFDREYLSQQAAAHRQALALLKSYGAAGDNAELRQFAQSTIPTVQMHAEWLDQNSPSPSATGGTPGATMGSTPAP
jgi:putative membrane protein